MKKHDIKNWPIVAGIFIGIGTGMITGLIVPFVLIGFGLGLLIVYLVSKKNK